MCCRGKLPVCERNSCKNEREPKEDFFMDTLIRVLFLVLLLGAAPLLVGGIFVRADGEGSHLPSRWVSGQMFLWAGFQIICVPLILIHPENSFRHLCMLFGGFMAAALLLALGELVGRRKKQKALPAKKQSSERDKVALFLWLLFFSLLVLQQVLAATMAYEEGDDAYYVSTSVITENSNTMYQILPYTGFATGLDARHGLAPFPVWVAFLSRLCGIHAATMSQIVLPVVLIAMAYSVFYLLGRCLLEHNRRGLPLFMLFIELLVIFGGQSLYTSENFLLVRTAQGKAVLANIVIPFLFWLLLIIAQRLQRGERVGFRYWLLTCVTMISGCLCSTQGALMVCLLLGVGILCIVVCYHSWKEIPSMAACCALPTIFVFLYLMLN